MYSAGKIYRLRGLAPIVFCIAVAVVLPGCSVLTEEDAEDRDFGDQGQLKNSLPLSSTVLPNLVGNYRITVSGTDKFSGPVSVISSNGRISLLSYERETFAVMNAGCVNNEVIFEGRSYDPASQEGGLVRMRIEDPADGTQICLGNAPVNPHVTYIGVSGRNKNALTNTIRLEYVGPLKTINKYLIGHHGCRTVDNCGASENTLESIRLAGNLGANSVEIDVHMSKDQVPVLYHDDDFNSRLVSGIFCLGAVGNYTVLQMKVFCRLKYGERIPTLREALEALLTDDTMKLVWLDPKTTSAIPQMVALANEYKTKAAALVPPKQLEILIGIPDDDYLSAYTSSAGYETTSCLVEYDFTKAMANNCRAYGPRFTVGPQRQYADILHASGKLIFYWTVNDKDYFPLYFDLGAADGLISDRIYSIYTMFQQ